MHVALYEPSASLIANGSVRVQLELARGFLARNHQVDYLCKHFSGELEHLVPNGLRGYELGRWGKATRASSIASYLREHKPDILLSADETFGTCIAARTLAQTKTKVIATIHDPLSVYFKDRGSFYTFSGTLASKMVLPLIDKVVAVSEAVAQDLENFNLNPEQIEIIYNPVDVEALSAQSLERITHPWFNPKSKPVIVSVGRLSRQKNYASLLHIFKRLREFVDAQLIIAGEGIERRLLENLVKDLDLGDHVDLPGFVANPSALIKNADVFALTSHYESFGLVLAEALTVGTPIVAFDCAGGVREVLADGHYGKLIAESDTEGFAKALLETLENPPCPETLKSRAQDFNSSVSVEKYLEVISDLF